MFFRLWNGLVNALAIKQSCLICKQISAQLICRICCNDLEQFDLEQCQGNLLNLPAIEQVYSKLDAQALFAVAPYQWPLANLLTQLKFSNKIIHAQAIANLFNAALQKTNTTLPQAIIPIPLHSSRFRQRKYNQALEIAEFIAKTNSLILDVGHCLRHKATQPQTSLSGAQRRQNIRNAFTLASPLPYQHIAIFDDIVTTGTTVNELIRCIRQHNPHIQIDVWCICVSLANKHL